jgi:hypothetical protein
MGSRSASYEAAVSCVRGMRRVRQFELGARIGADWRLARAYLDRMEREGVVGPMRPTGWRDVAGQATEAGPRTREPPVGPQGDPRIQQQLEAIRRLIARELHPDSSPGDEPARVVKEVLFKRVWPRMQALLAECG